MNTFDSPFFLENIEWFDESGKELVHRLPERGSGEIKYGAQLTVRESQAAVLFYQGKACDSFAAGRHTLKTANLPLVTKLLSLPWKGDSPLRAEVYMVNLKHFTNLKWGTQNPIAFRDTELGLIRLRAHGIFTIQVVQPVLFINALVGTMGKLTTDTISDYLKLMIVSRLSDLLGEQLETICNLPGSFAALADGLTRRLRRDFEQFGLGLTGLYISSITPPAEVQQAIDDKARMNVIGDMEKFMRLKAAVAIEKAAENQNETSSMLGMGVGMMLPRLFGGSLTAEEKGTAGVRCIDCGNQIPSDARFCPLCGHQQVVLVRCRNCGKNLTPSAKFCSRCGEAVGMQKKFRCCRECGTENLAEAIFCNNCGTRLE